MHYLDLRNAIFQTIVETETKHNLLLQHAEDPEVLLDFPCNTQEEYTRQTGKNISTNDYRTIILINSLYNALYELDTALEAAGYEVDC